MQFMVVFLYVLFFGYIMLLVLIIVLVEYFVFVKKGYGKGYGKYLIGYGKGIGYGNSNYRGYGNKKSYGLVFVNFGYGYNNGQYQQIYNLVFYNLFYKFLLFYGSNSWFNRGDEQFFEFFNSYVFIWIVFDVELEVNKVWIQEIVEQKLWKIDILVFSKNCLILKQMCKFCYGVNELIVYGNVDIVSMICEFYCFDWNFYCLEYMCLCMCIEEVVDNIVLQDRIFVVSLFGK